jgi:hypothetical protein
MIPPAMDNLRVHNTATHAQRKAFEENAQRCQCSRVALGIQDFYEAGKTRGLPQSYNCNLLAVGVRGNFAT